MEFAKVSTNLGSAYLTLAQFIDRTDNCKQAIASYQKALLVYSPDRYPEQYAAVKNNLAITYLSLSEVVG